MFRLPAQLFAAWSLLAVMTFGVVPRELLHACETHAGHAEQRGSVLLDASCPVCDAAIPVAIGTYETAAVDPCASFDLERSDVLRAPDTVHTAEPAGRGPPALG